MRSAVAGGVVRAGAVVGTAILPKAPSPAISGSFSGISFGLVYVILFIVLWEILYFLYSDSKNMTYTGEDRLLFALGSIMGFLLGRFMHDDDDHRKEYLKFRRDYDKCGEACGWF